MTKIWILIIYISIITVSCDSFEKRKYIGSTEYLVDSLPGECPYLTKDHRGNIVLSWVRILNDASTEFCYAVSVNGKTFSKPITVPGSGNIAPHGENLPKLIFKPSGEILALWGAANPNANNKYSGLVYYVQSFNDGLDWTLPKPLINDTNSYDQRYYDVALLPDGEVGAIWLDNRKTVSAEGSGLYFASTAGTDGFKNDRLISEPCCQCCRTDLFVDKNGAIHTLYRGIIQDSIRDMVHARSVDGGKTFSRPVKISDDNWVINGCPHTGPSMAEINGRLAFAWFTGGRNKGCYSAISNNKGISFSPRLPVSSTGSHPQISAISDDEYVIVWDENVSEGTKVFKRIGLLKRNVDGIDSDKGFISSDTGTASYPVIVSTGKKNVLVAYTSRRSDHNYVAYQIIPVAD
jgi:hypothetical protein